ncbi:hypothetical protein ACF0H5_019198 [Mactra antiquata]
MREYFKFSKENSQGEVIAEKPSTKTITMPSIIFHKKFELQGKSLNFVGDEIRRFKNDQVYCLISKSDYTNLELICSV